MILTIFILSLLVSLDSISDMRKKISNNFLLLAPINILSAALYFTLPVVWISLLCFYSLILINFVLNY